MPKSIMKSILVSIDRSSDSTPAMELALRWAIRFDAGLVAVGFIDEIGIEVAQEYLYREGHIASVNPPLIARVQQDYKRILEQYAARCAAAGASCTTPSDIGLSLDRVALRGPAARPDRDGPAARPGARLRGPAGSGPGPHPQEQPSPRRDRAAASGHGPSEGEILVAYDGSLQSARALYAAVFSVLGSDVKVHVVSVAAGAVGRRCRGGRGPRVPAPAPGRRDRPPDRVPTTSPATVLLDQVGRLGAGLIVMGAYGEPVLREFFLGSVSRTLLKESPVPVFLAH